MALKRIALPWLLATLVLSALTGPAASQTTDPASPEVPDPGALSADWWSYFESAGEDGEERVDALEAYRPVLEGMGQDDQAMAAAVRAQVEAEQQLLEVLDALDGLRSDRTPR